MRQLILCLSLLTILLACSRLNVSSQDYYNKKHIRHGIIPLSNSAAQKLSENTIQRGKILYDKHCLSCHGKSGTGDGIEARDLKLKPANLQKLVKDVQNFTFFMSISQWQGDMPGWKESFNEIEREELVAYIKSFRN